MFHFHFELQSTHTEQLEAESADLEDDEAKEEREEKEEQERQAEHMRQLEVRNLVFAACRKQIVNNWEVHVNIRQSRQKLLLIWTGPSFRACKGTINFSILQSKKTKGEGDHNHYPMYR